jgi:Type II secretion system (T2SS), protein N
MILIGLAAVLAAIVATLPASLIARFLPPGIVAEEFSGSVWHGSAGKIRVTGRDAGALEWWLHPASLLGMALSADLHWVKVGFVIDAAVKVDRHGFAAHGIKGGGPIEDLRDLGVAAGWRGIAEIHLSRLQGDFASPHNAAGDLKVSNLTGAQFADGANLGGYLLQIPEGPPGTDGSASGQITDTGGPLEAQISLHYTAKDRALILSGTLRERAEAPPALRSQLQNLAQYRGRDPQGRIPVDLEFTL